MVRTIYPTDQTCIICKHSREAHDRVKGSSNTGCLACECRSFRESSSHGTPIRGDAEPEFKK